MTLQPGQSLSAEDCKLLEAGDWLLHKISGDPCILTAAGEYLEVERRGAYYCDAAGCFLSLGRPGADGFIPWTGGENPLPGGMVECLWSNGAKYLYVDLKAALSAESKSWRKKIGLVIQAWRPAPSVEGLGALPEAAPLSVPSRDVDADALERLARHLLIRFHRGAAGFPVPWERLSDYGKENWTAEAADALAALSASGPAGWQPIETAPKDKPILAWCETECGDPDCAYGGGGSSRLCLYHGHAEGLSFAPTGVHILEWGGSWDDRTHKYDGGHMPDWWFVVGSEFEQAANPTHWQPLPEPPALSAPGSQKGAGE